MIDSYIVNETLNIYLEQLDYISDLALEEYNEIDSLVEAEAIEGPTSNDNKSVANSNMKKEKFAKLREILNKFIEVITGIINKIKPLIDSIKQRAKILLSKGAIEATNDYKIINTQILVNNTPKVFDIHRNLVSNIIDPASNKVNPSKDIQEYQDEYDQVDIRKITGDESNFVNIKAGAKVRGTLENIVNNIRVSLED